MSLAFRCTTMRVSYRTVREAFHTSPLLPPLLSATKSLQQAKNELRWIQAELPRKRWLNAVLRRSRLEPLQYILGTQPFGPLEIRCGPNVLIPRWETEEWALRVALLVMETSPAILDACTGTGCIPLLLKHTVPGSEVRAFDYSHDALLLAAKNRAVLGLDVHFYRDNVFRMEHVPGADLVTANPPYIFRSDFHEPLALNGVEALVRLYEPSDALIGELEFYGRLMEIVKRAGAKGLVFELGYEEQVRETVRLLPGGWKWGRFWDSAGNLRCVVAWAEGSEMEVLRGLPNQKT